MVPEETRSPANRMIALGSARFTSPTTANEAKTPPVVGSVMTEMNGTRAALTRSTTPIVLTSCISEYVPSCIRAPPEEEMMRSGIRRAIAASPARATFSPTTEPIEPPMKPKSMTHIDTGRPPMLPTPHTAASRRPVESWAAISRSG